jgi:oligoribonuclease
MNARGNRETASRGGKLSVVPLPDSTAPASPDARHLAWIDLEMTGLVPDKDVILQAALVVTTPDLTPLTELSLCINQPDEALARMTPFVRDMHARTGLIERVRQSTTTLAEAERLLLERLRAWCPAPATLCGNSIWVDRSFISRYMPALDGHLHYRMVDVSSVKVLAGRWYGNRAVFDKSATGAHDALVDIHNSIAELRHYRQTLFRAVE